MTKRNKIIYWIFTVWLALGMTSTGMAQLFKMQTGAGSADSIAHLGYPAYFVTLLGTAKILGVVAVLIPRFPLLKEWAYAGFFFMMSGAVISHIAMGNGIGETFPSVLLLTLTAISWFFRPADRKMISVSQ
jgi:hypothetical protein